MGNFTNPSFSINCRGKLHVFDRVVLMGILNATPDSFYDGGQFTELNFAIEHAAKMLAEGADIIDVGGVSTRPNAKLVSEQEELERVIPLIEKLRASFKEILISVDTYRASVAQEAYTAGADIINDISGGQLDEEMFDTVAKLKIPYIVSHIQGTPQNMQDNPQYKDVVLDVIQELSTKVNALHRAGVMDVIVDPGFGFGKTVEQNFSLLMGLRLMTKTLNRPVLAGVSRKSMLYKPLGLTAGESLNATSAAHLLAIQNGASLLRVHDVKEAKQVVKIWDLAQSQNQ